MAEAGEARREVLELETYVVGSDRLYVFDNGEVRTGYAKFRDYPGENGEPRTVLLPDKRGLQSFFAKARRGIRGLLAILETPGAALLGALVGIDVPDLVGRAHVFDAMSSDDKITKVLGEIGERKASIFWDELRKAKADGVLTADELARLGELVKELT